MVLQFHRNANLRLAHKFMLHSDVMIFLFFMVRPIFVHSKIKIPHAINDEFIKIIKLYNFINFYVIIQHRRRPMKIFSVCNKILCNKKYFIKSFLEKHHRVMLHVMSRRCTMYMSWCQHVYFGGLHGVCRKTPFWGGVSKMVVFWGGPKKGHF